jgi:hypothetical protein
MKRAQGRTNEEIVRHFENRVRRLKIVTTTRTPSGHILDWIKPETQRPGLELASPPPGPVPSIVAGTPPVGTGELLPVQFELEEPTVERGPAGTVPIARKDFSRLRITSSLANYLAKRGKRGGRAMYAAGRSPGPAPNLVGYFHATSGQSAVCFGAEATLNVWDPYIENSGDHSLMQLGLVNFNQAQLQTLEAGWEVSNDQYGDWGPHLFIFYTTNGYTKEDDNLGGYNQDVDGWVQVDDTIYPAAPIGPVSAVGGDQWVITIKYQLYESNWWFQVQGKWIGYYPASLFKVNQSVANTLGDHAEYTGFWGEVYTDNRDPNTTLSDMGSGVLGEGGWAQACFQSNLRLQSDRSGSMSEHDGFSSAENPRFYDIRPFMKSATSWGSYFYAGGPGALVPWVDNDLTAFSGGTPAAPGSALDGYWGIGDDSQHVNFLDGAGHVHELYITPSS